MTKRLSEEDVEPRTIDKFKPDRSGSKLKKSGRQRLFSEMMIISHSEFDHLLGLRFYDFICTADKKKVQRHEIISPELLVDNDEKILSEDDVEFRTLDKFKLVRSGSKLKRTGRQRLFSKMNCFLFKI